MYSGALRLLLLLTRWKGEHWCGGENVPALYRHWNYLADRHSSTHFMEVSQGLLSLCFVTSLTLTASICFNLMAKADTSTFSWTQILVYPFEMKKMLLKLSYEVNSPSYQQPPPLLISFSQLTMRRYTEKTTSFEGTVWAAGRGQLGFRWRGKLIMKTWAIFQLPSYSAVYLHFSAMIL